MESIWDQILSDKKVEEKESTKTIDLYLNLSFEEIKKRNLAFQIYSKVLNDVFWISSNDEMVDQIKQDDPESVVYHIDEIEKIIKMKPDVNSLKGIHEAKRSFKNSKIIYRNHVI